MAIDLGEYRTKKHLGGGGHSGTISQMRVSAASVQRHKPPRVTQTPGSQGGGRRVAWILVCPSVANAAGCWVKAQEIPEPLAQVQLCPEGQLIRGHPHKSIMIDFRDIDQHP